MRRRMRMSGGRRILAALAAALLASPPAALAGRAARNPPAVRLAAASDLTLRSPDIPPGGTIALTYAYDQSGCHGGNVSPALAWDRPPAGTRSFAITMFDPDAAGGGWWHWAVFDIPARVSSLQAGAGDPAKHLLPAGTTQVRNDFGTLGYGGPCPPAGPLHHYRLVLYALRVATLGLDASASPAQVAAKAQASALAEAAIVGTYGR